MGEDDDKDEVYVLDDEDGASSAGRPDEHGVYHHMSGRKEEFTFDPSLFDWEACMTSVDGLGGYM